MKDYFKIGEISKLYHIGVDSLRYYEKIGVLHPERGEGGYRHYSVRDIWKLNTIRDLRGLGFGMEKIKAYLEDHTVESTLALLEKEQSAIDDKIRQLERLRDNVTRRMETIQSANQMPLEVIALTDCPPRRCCAIEEGYSDEHEMDVLIKRLMNLDREHQYVIGSNQIGSVIPLGEAEKTGKIHYISVFAMDEKGEKILPGGTYLTVSYRGAYEKTKLWVPKLLAYAEAHSLRLRGDILEILWIDIHTSERIEEHITQLQILADPK